MKKLIALIMAVMMLSLSIPAMAEATEAPLYTEEDIMIDAGDHQIPATVTLPVVNEGVKVPAVIMLHGNGSTRHEAGNAYDYTAPEMAKAGIATIRFDYIGNGDSASDYIDFTYDKAVADAMKCYDYLATLGVIDMDRVGIMGWSMGGFITLLTAARNDVFASVMTWAGAFYTGRTEALEAQYAVALENGYYEVLYDWRDSLKQAPAFYECVFGIDAVKEVANIKAPILALTGSEDTVVPPSVAEQIVAAATSEGTHTKLLNGADHTFCVFTGDTTQLQNVTNETIQWFTNTLVYDIIDQDMTYTNRDVEIKATLVTPENAESYPVVVLVHGHGGSRDECFGYIDIANELAKNGVASLRMDFPGCGESVEPFTENNLTNMISDVNAGIAWVKENLPATKIGIMGYSMGGRITNVMLSQGTQFDAVAFLAPATEDAGLTAPEMYEAAKANGYYEFHTPWGQTQQLAVKFFEDMLATSFDAIKDAAKATLGDTPVLILQAQDDSTVSPAATAAMAEFYGAEITDASGNDHSYSFYSTEYPELRATIVNAVAEFFAANLK